MRSVVDVSPSHLEKFAAALARDEPEPEPRTYARRLCVACRPNAANLVFRENPIAARFLRRLRDAGDGIERHELAIHGEIEDRETSARRRFAATFAPVLIFESRSSRTSARPISAAGGFFHVGKRSASNCR